MIFPSLSQSNPAGNLKDIITLEQFHGNIVPECDLPEHFNGEMPHGTRQGGTPPRRPSRPVSPQFTCGAGIRLQA